MSKNRGKPRQSAYQPKLLETPFEEHWSLQKITSCLKAKEAFLGTIRVNPKNFEQAFVADDNNHKDILFLGLHSRNRSLPGDVVVYVLHSKSDWNVSIEQLAHALQVEKHDLTTTLNRMAGPKQKIQEERLNPYFKLEMLPHVLSSFHISREEYVLENYLPFIQKTGKVVGIYKKVHSRKAVGLLKPMQDTRDDCVLFCPTEHALPRLRIPRTSCPSHFLSNPTSHANTIFAAFINDWSRNSPFGSGTLIEELGDASSFHVQIKALLWSNDVRHNEFSEAVLSCLSDFSDNWEISVEEISHRRDFRDNCVFTVDPITARDLDDALHCKALPNGDFEVGVHIADVSYFITENSDLDLEAGNRSTSVYLPDRVIPMLPRVLCENLCSLNPGVDRLTFSVVWQLSPKGDIVSQWIGKAIIRSCAKLSYEDAQLVFDDPHSLPNNFAEISYPHEIEDVCESLKHLFSISHHLLQQRKDNGAIRLDKPKISFSCNDQKLPIAYTFYQRKESHRMVEEFMLLANTTVAKFIYEKLPATCVLRGHAPPKQYMIKEFHRKCSDLDLVVDVSSSYSIAKSLDDYQISAKTNILDQGKHIYLIENISKLFTLAEYYCSSNSFLSHYALSIDIYTHFTSPIRRYPDVLVHRQLASILDQRCSFQSSAERIEELLSVANTRKYSAKKCSEKSCVIFLQELLKDSQGISTYAVISEILSYSLEVITFEVGLPLRLSLKADSLVQSFKNNANLEMDVKFKNCNTKCCFKLLDVIKVLLCVEKDQLSVKFLV